MNMIWFGWDMFKHLIVHVQLCTINLGQPWDHYYRRRPPGTFLKRDMISLPCSKPPQYIHSSEKQDYWARKSHLESGLKGSFRQRKNYPDLMEIICPLFSSSNSPEIASNHSADSQKEGSNLCINRPKTHPIATRKICQESFLPFKGSGNLIYTVSAVWGPQNDLIQLNGAELHLFAQFWSISRISQRLRSWKLIPKHLIWQ